MNIKMAGMACSVAGAVIGVIGGIIQNKTIEAEIEEKVNAHFETENNNTEDVDN